MLRYSRQQRHLTANTKHERALIGWAIVQQLGGGRGEQVVTQFVDDREPRSSRGNDGRFVPPGEAKRRPKTTVTETVPVRRPKKK